MDKKITQEMLSFIEQSPSCYHAVETMSGMLKEAGFIRLSENKRWELTAGQGYYVTRNDSALLAFRIPEMMKQGTEKENLFSGFLIAAAHSDAPALKIKAKPTLINEHYVRLNVEKYGGAILSSWFDRPLSIAGRVTLLKEGMVKTRLVNFNRDLALIPNLAIHMNRQMNEGVALNPQVDMLPVLGQAGNAAMLSELLAAELNEEKEAILDYDLFLYPREQGRIWGAEEEFISTPRLDDLQCAWACLKGLLDAAENTAGAIPVCAVFDNEEVGSGTKQGADSDFLSGVLERIAHALGCDLEQYRAALASSLMVSADNGHAIHPNHPEKADAENHPHINGGVVIKYSANQKYTTDAVSAAIFKVICSRAGVPVQTFINRSDVAGGSTLGNLSNKHVSLNTVDVGLAQLAMHSAVETGGTKDTRYLFDALKAFYQSGLKWSEDGCRIAE